MLERTGTIAGLVASPAAYLGAALRHARLFHPRGATFQATVIASPTHNMAAQAVGDRLSGPALVRFSTALRRRNMHGLDILGCAIRFGWDGATDDEAWQPDQQDMLLATIRFPLTIPAAFLTTRQDDFFANHYFGISRFRIEDAGIAKLRLRAMHHTPPGGDKFERLAQAVEEGTASLILDAGRFGFWRPLVRIELQRPVSVDEEELRFSPYHDGRGIHPIGFLNATRRATYQASQEARHP
jgi:hypothetical protein